ncbi:unnamed protein product [Dovyalis caffra]|uniref:Uncharacterized protein n=1 Tax=Dovyalis caffra TaxID=77055 RepID=A0AAV1R7B6_9ROSI|nr:unnamed protein product [Dovyalis caffra]
MIERLFLLLQDPDYRVRFSLAQRIGVLFQTWDGHGELFQDICSNFGVAMVIPLKGKVVTAKEVLASGPQPTPKMETIIQLQIDYAPFASLLEKVNHKIRQLFVPDAEPSYFMQYCCHWLLPALVLNEDSSNLNWVARRSGWERGAMVLQSSILCLAELSESERDNLIKKHMVRSFYLEYKALSLVSIVSHVLSLASCALDPAIPFFSRETVSHAIRTVVDGFLAMEDYPTNVAVLDKINIFRPDRVFMFLVEMHYKIEAAVHHRHRCHRLASIEVLVDIIGPRAAVSSTSNYLFNLVGQFIGCDALQDQCCRVVSALLNTFKCNPSKDIASVLGEQLQFLVSKLVACCIPSETSGEISGTRAYEVLSLLRQLTVGSDPSLHDYVRELEPFPEIDIFDDIREFHQQLCQTYSLRVHLLKFVKRSFYLPPRLLLQR